jgi:integrase/recombinase XerD
VVFSSNGRIKQDLVFVDDREQRHPEGAYYIEWRENGKRIRESVGKNAPDALSRKLRQAHILASKALGISIVDSSGHDTVRSKQRPIAEAVKRYLEEIRLSRALRYAFCLHSCTPQFQRLLPKEIP